MIPLRDNVKSRTFPIVNTILIIANVLVFLYELHIGGALRQFIFENGLIPSVVTSMSSVPFDQRFVPFFTSMFIHGGWLHVIGNMLFLYIFGDNVEDRIGHFKYLGFYLLSGIGAALLQIFMNLRSDIPMIGASGAISGVLGAYLMFFPNARVLTLIPIFIFIQLIYIPASLFIIFWFAIQFISGVSTVGNMQNAGGVAFWAHVGGFVAGLLIAMYFRKKSYRQNFSNGYNF